MKFNNTEEYWFSSWVVMRRKFLTSEKNNKELVKDVIYWKKRAEKLEQEKGVFIRSKKDIMESKKRELIIKDFNEKNNRERKKRRKRVKKYR